MTKRILVTPRSATKAGHLCLKALEESGYEMKFCRPGVLPTEEELLGLLPGCVGYLAGVETISARALQAAKDLRVISRNGTGADAIDRAEAERLGIQIVCAHGANARGVAELTMTFILALARSLTQTDRALKAQKWERFPGFELEGKTLGLVGCGRIGQLVAGFATAFGMAVLAHDPLPTWTAAPAGFRYAGLDEVLGGSDFLSLHCPPASRGRPVLDGNAIQRLKRGVMVINTARGGLIAEDAMFDALETGQVAGLGLDVFDQEPPREWRLALHPRVIASPHIGGYTPESIDHALSGAVHHLINALS